MTGVTLHATDPYNHQYTLLFEHAYISNFTSNALCALLIASYATPSPSHHDNREKIDFKQ